MNELGHHGSESAHAGLESSGRTTLCRWRGLEQPHDAHVQGQRVPGMATHRGPGVPGMHRSHLGQKRGGKEVRMKKLREETPGRKTRQQPAGIETRAHPKTWPGSPSVRPCSDFGPLPGRGQTSEAHPDGTPCKHTEKWRQDQRQAEFPRASRTLRPQHQPGIPQTRARVTTRRAEQPLCPGGLIHTPFAGSGGGTRGCLSCLGDLFCPPLCLSHGEKTVSPLGSLGLSFPLHKRSWQRWSAGHSDMPGFSAPGDGRPRNSLLTLVLFGV